jgi:pilus assembly protein Flp/PilA
MKAIKKLGKPLMWLKSFANEKGQGLIEYALIIALIVLVAIALLSVIGKRVNNVYSNINQTMQEQGVGGGG